MSTYCTHGFVWVPLLPNAGLFRAIKAVAIFKSSSDSTKAKLNGCILF